MTITQDEGSIIPLGIGVIALTAFVAFVFAELIGVQYQTIQNKQLADVLVLKVASDLRADAIAPVANLDYGPVAWELLKVASSHMQVTVSDFSLLSRDGKTVEATVCSEWNSLTGLSFGSYGKVCASSKARAIS